MDLLEHPAAAEGSFVPPAGAADPPLAETLRRVGERNPYVRVRLGRPEEPGWLPATALVAAGSSPLDRLLGRIGAELATARRDVPASFFVHGYGWLLAAVGVGAYLVDRRVPTLSPESVMVRFDEGGYAAELALLSDRFAALPGDPAAVDRAASVVGDAAALRDGLRAQLEAHLAPLIGAVRARAPLGTRAMWSLVADACAWCVLHHADAAGGPSTCRAEVAALTQAAGSALRGRTGVVEVEGEERWGCFVARASCCLNYKLAERTHCDGCPLLEPEERERRLRASLAGGS